MSSGPRKADGFDGATSDHVVKILLYNATITGIAKGDTVMVDTASTTYGLGNSVIEATQALGAFAVGIADAAPTAAGDLLVQVSGIRTDVNCHADTVAGDRLAPSSVAGRLGVLEDIISADTSQADFNHSLNLAQRALTARLAGGVAVALTDDSATTNVCTARLLDPMNLAH